MSEVRVAIRVDEAPFEPGTELLELEARSDGDVGAVATFIGYVRDRVGEDDVASLTLEHYPGMTEKSIDAIVREALKRWPLKDVVVIHRVGTLSARERIVYVQVAAGHRDAAFSGAEFIMDYLKTDAVFWKRERRAATSEWITSTDADRARRRAWEGTDPDR